MITYRCSNPIVIAGKMGAGKSSVAQCLEQYGSLIDRGITFRFYQVKTYTTRQRRLNEKEDAYHFVDKETFEEMIQNDRLIEYYLSSNGTYYGSCKEDIVYKEAENGDVYWPIIVLTIDGAEKLDSKYSYYLVVDNEILQKRLLQRGDKEIAIKERIEQETKQENLSAETIKNTFVIINCGTKGVLEVAKDVLHCFKFYKR